MLSEREWLDASIRRWERVRELVDKRLKLYVDLRTQLDADWADLKRIMDEDATVSSMMRGADASESSRVDGVNVGRDEETIESNGKTDGKSVDELTSGTIDAVNQANSVTETAVKERDVDSGGNERENDDENEAGNEVENEVGNDGEDDGRQIRGDRNPNRLLILDLTAEQALTVTGIQRELAARGKNLSKQSIDNWVKRLLKQGLLDRETSPDPASKFQYRRSSKPDVLDQVA